MHESLVKTDKHFPKDPKKTSLKNAVSSSSNSRAVKDQSDQVHTNQGIDLDYEQYSKLILSASADYDAQLIPSSAKVSQKGCDSEIGNHDFY